MNATDAAVLARRHAALWARRHEPHVAPIVVLADRIAVERGLPPGIGRVPYPCPDGAGVHARVLFLLNDPGDGARDDTGGTGMLSMVNNDPTTRNQRKAIAVSRFDRRLSLHWNGIPWPVPRNERNRNMRPAAPYLVELLDVLAEHGGQLHGVVTLGEFAHKVWAEVNKSTDRFRHLEHVPSEHPAARSTGVDLTAAYQLARESAATG